MGVPHGHTSGDALTDTPDRRYDRVMPNPPYKKMAAGDVRQIRPPAGLPIFIRLLFPLACRGFAKDGELLAIVPRSWMSGDRFAPFRRYAMDFFSLDTIHVYGSRTEVLSETKVLQETMLVRFSNRKQADHIKVTHSAGKGDEAVASEFGADDLIDPFTYVVRIASKEVGVRAKRLRL